MIACCSPPAPGLFCDTVTCPRTGSLWTLLKINSERKWGDGQNGTEVTQAKTAVAWSRVGARAVLRSGEALGVFGRKSQQDLLTHHHVLGERERGAWDRSEGLVLSSWEEGGPPAAPAEPPGGHHDLQVGHLESETPG